MLKDADPNYFAGIYIVCGYTNLRCEIDSLAAIIEQKYKLSLFVPNTLFLFCGRSTSKIKGLLWEGDGFLVLYKRLHIIPETFIVDEHHVHIYASKDNDGTIVKAERPVDLFRNSIATPSLVASIINGTYVNALPIDRLSRSYKCNGINLATNTIANWVIKSADNYLSLVYDCLHELIYDSRVIHADETPVKVMRIDNQKIRDGKKTQMWIYRNRVMRSTHPIILYDWQSSRKADHPREFLKQFSDTVVTDDYEVYHKLAKRREDLTVAGCWIHARKPYAEFIKSLGRETSAKGSIA